MTDRRDWKRPKRHVIGNRPDSPPPAIRVAEKVPNATTVKAIRAAGRGKGKRLKSTGALFKGLGI